MLSTTQELTRHEAAQIAHDEFMAQIEDYVAEEFPVLDEDIPVFEWLGEYV